MRETIQISCVSGVFTLPAEVFAVLKRSSSSGMIYLREGEESVVISPTPVTGGRKRQINQHYRVSVFQDATKLALVEVGETILLMAVSWRPGR